MTIPDGGAVSRTNTQEIGLRGGARGLDRASLSGHLCCAG